MPPPGWYPDPSLPQMLRWWDGGAWTANLHPTVKSPRPRWSLPRPWLILAAVLLVVGLVCFGRAETTTTPHPGSWFLAGLASTGALTLIGGCLTLGGQRWREVARLALIVA